MYTDHRQTLVLVLLRPRAQIGQRADAVDARIRPEIDQRDLALQLIARHGRRAGPGVEPLHGTVERRQSAFHRQSDRKAHGDVVGGEQHGLASDLRIVDVLKDGRGGQAGRRRRGRV